MNELVLETVLTELVLTGESQPVVLAVESPILQILAVAEQGPPGATGFEPDLQDLTVLFENKLV